MTTACPKWVPVPRESAGYLEVGELVNTPCLWVYDVSHDKWDTACGEAWQLMTGTPSENGMRFCPYCGWPLSEVVYKEQESKDNDTEMDACDS